MQSARSVELMYLRTVVSRLYPKPPSLQVRNMAHVQHVLRCCGQLGEIGLRSELDFWMRYHVSWQAEQEADRAHYQRAMVTGGQLGESSAVDDFYCVQQAYVLMKYELPLTQALHERIDALVGAENPPPPDLQKPKAKQAQKPTSDLMSRVKVKGCPAPSMQLQRNIEYRLGIAAAAQPGEVLPPIVVEGPGPDEATGAVALQFCSHAATMSAPPNTEALGLLHTNK